MKRCLLLLVMLLTGGALAQGTPEATLREVAPEGFYVGAAVNLLPLIQDQEYAEVLAREFNMVVAEDIMKFGALRPGPDAYNFGSADYLVEFASANDMAVRGHTLVWHNSVPRWLERVESRDEFIAILEEHVRTVVDRYKGRIVAWDVVNEAVVGDGSLRQSIFLERIGPEYIEMAFRAAHEADPEALLFYNDYSAEGLNRKSDAIYDLMADLLARGVPVHGVGLQMHIGTEPGLRPDLDDLAENIRRLNELGLTVQITEMDVRLKGAAIEEKLAEQAQVYQDVLEVCLSAESCSALVMWGFTDVYSWIPREFPGYGKALPFNELLEPKPAYHALLKTLTKY